MNTSATKEPTLSIRPAAGTATTTVAGYLLTRLAEAGVVSVFGMPGDYNLGLLDAVTGRSSMSWIGTASELGAGYAADSYARLRGLGALITTFGVGELSALNAVAGAYAESVPVVHIIGTPALAARRDGTPLHHNLPGGGYERFVTMAAEVTAAHADLRPDNAGTEIDHPQPEQPHQPRPHPRQRRRSPWSGVVPGRLVVLHADDDRPVKRGVGLPVAAAVELVPRGHAGRGRDGRDTAEPAGFRPDADPVVAGDDKHLGCSVRADAEGVHQLRGQCGGELGEQLLQSAVTEQLRRWPVPAQFGGPTGQHGSSTRSGNDGNQPGTTGTAPGCRSRAGPLRAPPA